MIIAKNDEAKRSKIWRMVTTGSSVLIVIIAIYLLTKMFTTNPLVGTWESEDEVITLEIRKGDRINVRMSDVAEDEDVSVQVKYTLDKKAKVLEIQQDEAQIDKVMEEANGRYTRDEIEHALDDITTSFNYSIDRKQMTLTEREYGEQWTFVKK